MAYSDVSSFSSCRASLRLIFSPSEYADTNAERKPAFLTVARAFSASSYFENMPDSTYDSGIKKIDLKRNDDIIDEEFEKTLDGFPDSYKPYLRYIHSIHSNWTFTPMKTNYDFNEGVTTENRISSIEISSGLCGEPYTVTEKGWCVSTREAVAFFLDSRNFLNETYIFMFENLGFKEIDESLIKGVLSGTFMDNIEPISNKPYSLLFLEAGRYAKVSALYLASLSRQEVGTKISNVTNGAEFTYEGYTYSGLYNFFSIEITLFKGFPSLLPYREYNKFPSLSINANFVVVEPASIPKKQSPS